MFLDLFVFSPFFLLQCGWDFFKLCKELTLPRFFFQLLAKTSQGKSFDTTGKGVFILVNLPSLKVTGLKRAKIQLCKAAKICRRLYRVGGKFVTPDHTNVCKISRLRGTISYVTFKKIIFKIGNFTNLKTLFPAESTEFP